MNEIIDRLRVGADMEGKKLFKSRRVFRAWFFSYVSVLLVPILITGIIYTFTGKMMEEEIGTANKSLLKQVQTIMDAGISEIEDLAMQIALNRRVKIATNVRGKFLPKDRMNLYEAAQDFKVYKLSSSFVDDVFLYMKNTDTVIEAGTHMTGQRLYEFYFDRTGMTYEQWESKISKVHQRVIKPLVKKSGNTQSYNVLTYMQSLPIGSAQESIATIMITINEDFLIEIIENINWLERGTAFILDQNNQILMSTKPIELPESISYHNLGEKSFLENKVINGEKVAVSSIDSQVMHWKYVTIIPSQVFWEKARDMNKIIWIGILGCIIIGGVVAYIFTKLNYNPVNKIVQIFSGTNIDTSLKAYNEYKFIEESISSTLQEQKEMENKLNRQNKVLRENFLVRLLKGRLQDEFLDELEFPAYHITFDGEKFMVVLFHLENYMDTVELSQFVLLNIFEELVNKHFRGYMVAIDEMMGCIINGNNEEKNDMLDHIEAIIYKVKEVLKQEFGIDIIASISNIHDSLVGISEGYIEAFSAMEYRMLLDDENIIYYKDIQDPKRKYLYSMEMEQKLINNMKIGDFESAKELLDEIFQLHYSSDYISIEMGKCLIFDLISTMIKTVTIDTSNSEMFLEEIKPAERMMRANNFQEMKEQMYLILENVCDYMRRQKEEEEQEGFSEKVKKLILEKYSDENLNVSMLGEEFNITPAYLSKLFRSETGESLVDFINKVRIERAKDLLDNDEITVAQIASMVGYSSSNTFIRVFKKYEGITPGKYKSIL